VSPRALRRVLVAVCVAGIAGMIATSIADSAGGALTFGLLTAAAALGMILVTAVTTGGSAQSHEELAADVERRIEALVAAGANETMVRDVIRQAIRLGRATPQ
jgi:hypothetical protein